MGCLMLKASPFREHQKKGSKGNHPASLIFVSTTRVSTGALSPSSYKHAIRHKGCIQYLTPGGQQGRRVLSPRHTRAPPRHACVCAYIHRQAHEGGGHKLALSGGNRNEEGLLPVHARVQHAVELVLHGAHHGQLQALIVPVCVHPKHSKMLGTSIFSVLLEHE
eukprot:1159471-Pelagomonas_calceolata.AAC.10